MMAVIDVGDVTCSLISAAFGLMLIFCYGLGLFVRPRLPLHHRSQEASEVVLAIIAMLVTFSAIVLGLMLNSSLNRLQHLNDLVSSLANSTISLDDKLVEYGPDAGLAHIAVVNYLKGEQTGLSDEVSIRMGRASAQQIELQILHLQPADDYHKTMQHDALEQYGTLVNVRFDLLTEAQSNSNWPFYLTLGVWLMLTYFTFGLNSEPNLFIAVALTLTLVAIFAAVFVILDMDTALGGLISISREPLSKALAEIIR
jgi:hypothetical protein